MKKQIIRQMGIDAQTLYKRLVEAKVGEVISYSELNALIARNVQDEAYGSLTTARRRALRDDGIVFDAVHNVGLKRLADTEIIGVGMETIPKIRRIAKRGAEKLVCIGDFNALPNTEKIKHNTAVSLLGAMVHIATPKNIARIEKAVTNNNRELPVMKTLEAFRGA